MKYRYTKNISPVNSTDQIILEVDGGGRAIRTLRLGGEAEEVTYTQYLSLKDNFVLEPVKEEAFDSNKSVEAVTPEVAKSKETTVALSATQA